LPGLVKRGRAEKDPGHIHEEKSEQGKYKTIGGDAGGSDGFNSKRLRSGFKTLADKFSTKDKAMQSTPDDKVQFIRKPTGNIVIMVTVSTEPLLFPPDIEIISARQRE
jgi:hypothetical protein